jgi:hypothetical protein
MLSIQSQTTMITTTSNLGAKNVCFANNLTMVKIPKVSVRCSKMGERVPGLDHPPIGNWSKAKESEKITLVSNNGVMAGLMVFTKHNQAVLPITGPTKPQSYKEPNKRIANFGDDVNKLHPIVVKNKDLAKIVLGLVMEEDASKTYGLLYETVDLNKELKVMLANSTEKS